MVEREERGRGEWRVEKRKWLKPIETRKTASELKDTVLTLNLSNQWTRCMYIKFKRIACKNNVYYVYMIKEKICTMSKITRRKLKWSLVCLSWLLSVVKTSVFICHLIQCIWLFFHCSALKSMLAVCIMIMLSALLINVSVLWSMFSLFNHSVKFLYYDPLCLHVS